MIAGSMLQWPRALAHGDLEAAINRGVKVPGICEGVLPARKAAIPHDPPRSAGGPRPSEPARHWVNQRVVSGKEGSGNR